jgi:hypothetical protein
VCLFDVLLNSIKDVRFMIAIDDGMLSSVGGIVHLVREGEHDTRRWTIEGSGEKVDDY